MTLTDTGSLPFDPEAGDVSGDLASVASGPDGGVIVVVAAADPEAADWQIETAVSLARSWAGHAARFFLVDLSLEEPALHGPLELENEDGIVDVLLYGSAVQHVAQPADGGAFYFASAGTPTVDTEAVLTHERWGRIMKGFRSASATLCLYLPVDAPGAKSVLERADRVVVLRGGEAGLELPAGGEKVVAVLRPSTEAAQPEPADGAVEAAGPVVKIGELAPDEPEAEPVDIADLAPEEHGGTIEEEEARDRRPVMEIGELAPDEPEPVEIADLAPEGHPGFAPEEEMAAELEPGPTEDALEESLGFEEEPAPDEALEEAGIEGEPPPLEHTPFEEEPSSEGVNDELSPDEDGYGEPVEEVGAPEPESAAGEQLFGDFDMDTFNTHQGEDEDMGANFEDDDLRMDPEFGQGDETGSAPDESVTKGAEDAVGEPDDPVEDDSFDFGDLPGEMDVIEEAEEEDAVEDVSGGAAPSPDAAEEGVHATAEDEGEAGFGNDLVTGADFGQGAPEEEEGDWDDQDVWDEDAAGDRAVEPADEIPAERESGGTKTETVTPPIRPKEPEPSGSRPGSEEPPARSWPGRLARVLLVLLLAGGIPVGLHWFGVVQVPVLDSVLVRALGPTATAITPAVEVGRPTPETPIQGYSLAMNAYRNMESAAEVAQAWEGSFDGLSFSVAPVSVEGNVLYRLLAGPAGSAEEAEGLRSSLAEILTREDPSSWVVRATPLAFLLSEHEAAGAARTEAQRLSGEGVPAYVLRVTYPGELARYRVYAGAYESGEEARIMNGILIQKGYEEARFTERRGRLPE